MAETVVQLAPGESKEVLFEAFAHEARAYRVVIDGLEGSFLATQPPGLILGYKNPKQSSTHWHVRVFDIANKRWSADYMPEPIGSLKAFPDLTPGEFLLVFKESYNVFFNDYEYGPFLVMVPSLGVYTWDATSESLNGIHALDLPKSSNRCKMTGYVTWSEYPGKLKFRLDAAEAVSGYVNAGKYFIGDIIEASATENVYRLPGYSITATLQMVLISQGEYGYTFVWQVSNIRITTGWPSWAFDFSGSAWRVLDVTYYVEGFSQTAKSVHFKVNSNAKFTTFAVGAFITYGDEGWSFSWKNYPNNAELRIDQMPDDREPRGVPDFYGVQIWAHPDPNEYFDRPDYAAQRGWVQVATG